MRMIRLQRSACIAALLAATATPAFAQSPFSPATAICGLINFSFCPQDVPLTPPQTDAAPAFASPSPTDQKAAPPPPAKREKVALHKKRATHAAVRSKKRAPKTAAPAKTAD